MPQPGLGRLNVHDSGPVLGTIGATALLAAVAGAVYTNLYRKRLPCAEDAAGTDDPTPTPRPS